MRKLLKRWGIIILTLSNVILLSSLLLTIKSESNIKTEERSSLYTDYSSRILSTYRYMLQLTDYEYSRPYEAYLFSQGFLIGSSDEYYTKLEESILKLDDNNLNGKFKSEIENIIHTNKNLQVMVYELCLYLYSYQNQPDFQGEWGDIVSIFEKISVKLASNSSDDISLYNITSSPKDFIWRPGYNEMMNSLNEEIFKVTEIIKDTNSNK